MKEETRNSKELESFTEYCKDHPDQRFWQALTNWSGLPYVGWADVPNGRLHDMWNFE